jgi:hypothetical protein
MTVVDENSIWVLFYSNLKQAKANLAKLKVYCGKEPVFAGLSGWVFEQTIQHCIQRELEAQGAKPTMAEQVSLGGRVRADLSVGNVAIEIKLSGLYGLDGVRRYRQYRKAAEKKGFRYLFLTGGETYQPYRNGIIEALGRSNVFFLSDSGEWNRFVTVLIGPTRNKARGGKRPL